MLPFPFLFVLSQLIMSRKRSTHQDIGKRKKKQRIEQLVESQRGGIDKFFTSCKQAEQLLVEDLKNNEFETLVINHVTRKIEWIINVIH